jgi:hypothetical protein
MSTTMTEEERLRSEAEAKLKHADALEAYGRRLLDCFDHAVAERDRWRAACALVEPLLREHPDWTWKDAVAELRRRGLVPEPQPSRASHTS